MIRNFISRLISSCGIFYGIVSAEIIGFSSVLNWANFKYDRCKIVAV